MADRIVQNYLGQFQLKLDPRFHLEEEVLNRGCWEADCVLAIRAFLAKGQTCADVGANVGLFTLAMAQQVEESGKVFAFEPAALSFPRLVDNINLNPGLRRFVKCEKLALSDRDELLYCRYEGDAEFGNSRLERVGSETTGELCLATTLDKIAGDCQIDFIKIDAEGMEFEVLTGAARVLRDYHPVLYYETLLAKFDNGKLVAAETLLHSLDYVLFRLGRDGVFQETTYPHYAINTLAVHRSKLSQWPKNLRLL